MYINKTGLSEKESNRFESLVMESLRILNELIGVDETEDIYFDINDKFENEFGRTINLLGFRELYIAYNESENEMGRLFDVCSPIDSKICKEYETMIVINKSHFDREDDEEVTNTLIHEILHYLTNEEVEQHGNRWSDLAKYISKNSIYNIQETISEKFEIGRC